MEHAPTPYAGPSVAVLGGTGDQGRGLARRLAAAGVPVVLGSRDATRASAAAAELAGAGEVPAGGPAGGRGLAAGVPAGVAAAEAEVAARGLPVSGAENARAAADAGVVILAVPWPGHRALLEQLAPVLAGKVVVDCVNPLGFDAHGPYVLPVPEGSAAEQAAAALPESRVVGAFHHVSAVLLLDPAVDRIDMDVLVVGDDRAATDSVIELAERIPGVRGIYAGRLRNAAQVEAMTANLIAINRRYRSHAGLRVTGV